MASAAGNRKRRRASAGLIFLVLPLPGGVGAQEFRFADLKVACYYAPSFETGRLRRGGDSERLKAEIEDFEERLKKGWRVEYETWRAGEIPGVTVTVLRNLVQGASLRFDFPVTREGRGTFEISLPQGPDHGPVAVLFNERPALTLDPWSDRLEPVRWFRGEDPVEIRSGTNTMRVIQQSPQDLPIRLHSFRLAPLPKGAQPEQGLRP